MSIFSKPKLIKSMRERRSLNRQIFYEEALLDESTTSRAEEGKQNTRFDMYENMLISMGLPVDGFLNPLMEDLTLEVFILYNSLTQALDIGNLHTAQHLLDQLQELNEFDNEIVQQMYLSKKSRLLEQQKVPAEQIFDMIFKAINITYEDFNQNDFKETSLILEEPDLIHTLARVYALGGDIATAITILTNLSYNLSSLPWEDPIKERMYGIVTLSLTKFLLQTNAYENALPASILGLELSASYMFGMHAPTFESYRAQALYAMGKKEACIQPLKHAYFGNIAVGDAKKAQKVLDIASNYGITFDLYHTDTLELPEIKLKQYKLNPIAKSCTTYGDLIKTTRTAKKISLDNLASGICKKYTLQRLENNEGIHSNIFVLEAIMQRLGYNPYMYDHFFLKKDDFNAMQLRNKILLALRQRNLTKAAELLKELEGIKSFLVKREPIQINVQFIAMVKARLLKDPAKMKVALLKALHITLPDFDEDNILSYNLTNYELHILNIYASLISDVEQDNMRAANVYKDLRQNILSNYRNDEREMARYYSALSFNASTYLGRLEKRYEALDIIEEALEFDISHDRLLGLPSLRFNQAFNMRKLGIKQDKDYLALFATSYYTASMLSDYGLSHILPINQRAAKEFFNMSFI